jgi:hypothetical protein
MAIDVTGPRRQQAWTNAVAFSDAILGTFVAASADPLGCFDLDLSLHHEPHRITDEVDSLASAVRIEQLRQHRL